MARNHCPQVILMDINLPAISANATPQDIAKGKAADFFSYLIKPFKIEEFLEVLDQAVASGPTVPPQNKSECG